MTEHIIYLVVALVVALFVFNSHDKAKSEFSYSNFKEDKPSFFRPLIITGALVFAAVQAFTIFTIVVV